MANARTDAEGKRAMEAMAAIARDMLDKSENIDSDHVRRDTQIMRELPAQGAVPADGCAMGGSGEAVRLGEGIPKGGLWTVEHCGEE